MKLDPRHIGYRWSTIFRSFKALYTLTPQQVDAFVNSYSIYDCDWVEEQAVKDNQIVPYTDVKENVLTYYGVLNHLCAIGEVEKMYIPPMLDRSKSIIENQKLFEMKFSQQLELKAGHKVFELGCGKGRVAAHVSSSTGAHVTGINIDQGQLDSGTAFAKKNRLSHLCQFKNIDLNDVPFPYPDNSFDAIYEIQALSYSKNLDKLFRDLHRLLKPGGKVSLLEWVRLPGYDPKNPHHANLMRRTKPLIGAIGTPSPAEYEASLQRAGFDVLVSEEPSVNSHQGPLIKKTAKYFDRVAALIKGLVKVKVFPKHFVILFDRLRQDGEALREAENLGLVTTSYHLVAQKRS